MTLGRERIKYFEKPFVSWRNDVALFMGPRLAGYSAVDVEDLTAVELRSRSSRSATSTCTAKPRLDLPMPS